jgi:hypothetical protein
LNVAGFRSFHCSINQTFTSTHCMEEEFLWCESSQIRVLDETTAFNSEISSSEMR